MSASVTVGIVFYFSLQRVRSLLAAGERESQLVGASGAVWGVALVPRSKEESVINPVFVSVGHRISLETCMALTKAVGRYVYYCSVVSNSMNRENCNGQRIRNCTVLNTGTEMLPR